MNMPTESSPTATQDPLDLLLRAVDRVVNVGFCTVRHAPSMHESIMHLNNAAQYLRTVQKPTLTASFGTNGVPVVMPSPVFPSILLRSCRDIISDAKEIAVGPSQFNESRLGEFATECEEVLEHIKATMEANKS